MRVDLRVSVSVTHHLLSLDLMLEKKALYVGYVAMLQNKYNDQLNGWGMCNLL